MRDQIDKIKDPPRRLPKKPTSTLNLAAFLIKSTTSHIPRPINATMAQRSSLDCDQLCAEVISLGILLQDISTNTQLLDPTGPESSQSASVPETNQTSSMDAPRPLPDQMGK